MKSVRKKRPDHSGRAPLADARGSACRSLDGTSNGTPTVRVCVKSRDSTPPLPAGLVYRVEGAASVTSPAGHGGDQLHSSHRLVREGSTSLVFTQTLTRATRFVADSEERPHRAATVTKRWMSLSTPATL